MNFLAHCALAQDASECWEDGDALRSGLLAGAILADFGKGPVASHLPLELQTGIRLHRRIDAFTNQHDLIRNTCASFPPGLRRYAPIFLDILGDYYLSQTWDDYYAETRPQFSQRCYDACTAYAHHLEETKAPQLHTFMQYMRSSDLLANYHDWEHVERGLHSVLRRLGQTSLYEAVNIAADAQRDSGEHAFRLYFSDIRDQLPAWATLTAAVQ